MKKTTNIPRVAVVFDRKHRAKENLPQNVEIRVTIGTVCRFYPTGVKVSPSEWSEDWVIDRPDAPLLNERIGVVRRCIERYINGQLEKGKAVDFSDIKTTLTAYSDGADSFLDFVEERAAKRVVGETTRPRYYVLLRNLHQYGQIRRFADLTPEAIIRYNEWLHALRVGADKRPLSDGGVYNYHKTLKLFIQEAVVFGKININPYTRLPKGSINRGEHESVEYLTETEMQAIENVLLPTPSLNRARDLFVFQMYTGQSYCDMQGFNFRDYALRDGLYVYQGPRRKTGINYVTVLLPKALAVVEKYGHVLPVISNADYNKFLKTIAAHAGITKNLHSHLARHTFATYMLAKGSQLVNVSRMLGHSNVKMTQRYAKTLEASVMADFRRVIQ